MHRRAIIALAVATLGLGTIAYAADSGRSDSTDRTGSSAVSGENSTPSTGRMGTSGSSTGGDSTSVDRSVDTKKGSDVSSKHSADRSMTSDSRSVDEDENRGARTGGYLAAGIGIAALIGLFASRRSRAGRYDSDVDDDFRSPGPRV